MRLSDHVITATPVTRDSARETRPMRTLTRPTFPHLEFPFSLWVKFHRDILGHLGRTRFRTLASEIAPGDISPGDVPIFRHTSLSLHPTARVPISLSPREPSRGYL